MSALTQREREAIHGYWRAANYLAVGQIYLLDNPLLRKPLWPEHVKPRLPGHWGTSPELKFIYVHLVAHGEELPEIRDWTWKVS